MIIMMLNQCYRPSCTCLIVLKVKFSVYHDIFLILQKKVNQIMSQGSFNEDSARYMLYMYGGDVDRATESLCAHVMQPFIDNFWSELGLTLTHGDQSASQSQQLSGDSLNAESFVKNLKDKTIPKEVLNSNYR